MYDNHFERSELKNFLSNFFQKVRGVQGLGTQTLCKAPDKQCHQLKKKACLK